MPRPRHAPCCVTCRRKAAGQRRRPGQRWAGRGAGPGQGRNSPCASKQWRAQQRRRTCRAAGAARPSNAAAQPPPGRAPHPASHATRRHMPCRPELPAGPPAGHPPRAACRAASPTETRARRRRGWCGSGPEHTGRRPLQGREGGMCVCGVPGRVHVRCDDAVMTGPREVRRAGEQAHQQCGASVGSKGSPLQSCAAPASPGSHARPPPNTTPPRSPRLRPPSQQPRLPT